MLDNFSEDYLPETLIDREKEQQAIANFLKDISSGLSNVLYIHGSPGIGKTTVTKHVLNQFQDSTNDAIVIYLNCPNETPNLALKKIYEIICGEDQRRLASAVMMQVIQTLSGKYSLAIIGWIGSHRSMRFNSIMQHFKGISPKTLTDRLRELEKAGFLLRHTFSEIPPRVEYSLTAKGRETRELIKPFMEWVSRESMKLT